VTLNYNVLSKAKNIYLNITGSDKKTKLEYAAKEKNIMETPISIFLDHAIDIYWSP
jgi:6-phosphogluconolactonase/glucosamine-6-phosphate isomerase/deaminase